MSFRPVRRLSVLAMLLFAACARNAPQDTLAPEGPIARQIDGLFKPVFWVAVAVFVLVEGILVAALVRFRSRGERDIPVQTHGNTRLEIGWTIAPALLMAIVAVPTVAGIFTLSRKPAADASLTVKVTGKQWWWDYEYPSLGVRTANELHIPINTPVLLELESADVIHSYWVPKLAGKQDVVPGQKNHLTIEADKPDTYFGQCAEFCALSHANMRLRVISHTQDEFDAWVAAQRKAGVTGAAAEGERIFMAGKCVNCHAVKGTPAQAKDGPDLTHFASRATFGGATFDTNPDNLARWLRDPPEMKPGSKMPDYDLSEDEIEALVAYLMSLR